MCLYVNILRTVIAVIHQAGSDYASLYQVEISPMCSITLTTLTLPQ